MDRDTIRLNVLRNALYHSARYRSLERTNRFFNFLIVLLGASAMGSLTGSLGISPVWVGGGVAALGALQLVFDFGHAARDHQVLQRDYYWLLADIEAALNPSDEQLAAFQAKMIRITGDEPPTLRAIDARAYNDAIDGSGLFDRDEQLVIPWSHSLVGWLKPFEGFHYLKVHEVRAIAEAKAKNKS